MGKFKLVNPTIIGTFKNTYTANNADQAAQNFWENLTKDGKYIAGNIPKFLFTLQDSSSSELHHYRVEERPTDKSAEFSITRENISLSDKHKKAFLNEINKVQADAATKLQDGGKHRRRDKDDSSSSDSDSDDIDALFRYVRLRSVKKPLAYWWYTPSLYNIDYVYTPTFVAPVSPYVQLWVPANI